MQKFLNPKPETWNFLAKRAIHNLNDIRPLVAEILSQVKEKGDSLLVELGKKFDKVELTKLAVSKNEMEKAHLQLSNPLKKAIQQAYENIYTFHLAQQEHPKKIETLPGVQCWRKSVGIEKVGLYIPGGSAPLFSTVLMLGIPAKIAGCKQIVICTPPNKEGKVHPAILYTAQLLGINKIFKVGGAQAIGAMAYGTKTVPKVYKIFGPGNQYVTMAKMLVQQEGIAIDMPAGPSEVLVIADKNSVPEFVAADLLSQAEHGTDSQSILLSNDEGILNQCLTALDLQLKKIPRKNILIQSLKNCRAIVFEDLETCVRFSNYYAPEHLILAIDNPENYQDKITNAGSVFLGNYSCESAGDYASGTNHTLPTYGYAKAYSGVSLDSFVKKITYQMLSKKGLKNLGETIEVMAEAEQLQAHKNAVSLRLKSLKNE